MILVKAVQKSAIQKACNLHIHYYCFRVLPMRLGTTKKKCPPKNLQTHSILSKNWLKAMCPIRKETKKNVKNMSIIEDCIQHTNVNNY